MTDKDSLLAILELDCAPDKLIERAGWIAKAFDLNIHLVLYEPDSGALLGGFSVSSEADRLRQDIFRSKTSIAEEYADSLRADDIIVSTSVLELRPLGEGIAEIAAKIEPKLVVKATNYHTTAERSILVDSDWQLMRICRYPLWFVKSDSMPENPTIVAAVDPSNEHDKPAALDHEIVRNAMAAADTLKGDLQLLHVYEPLSGIGKAAIRAIKPDILPVDEIAAIIKKAHRAALDELAAAHDLDAKTAHQLPGRAHEIIPTFVRTRRTGLLVMGALARWGFKKMVIGSTTERVLDHIPSDVLIVRLGEHQMYP